MSKAIEESRPTLPQVRAALVQSLSQEQLNLVGAWLGLESLENGSEETFQAGKLALGYAARKGSELPDFRVS